MLRICYSASRLDPLYSGGPCFAQLWTRRGVVATDRRNGGRGLCVHPLPVCVRADLARILVDSNG